MKNYKNALYIAGFVAIAGAALPALAQDAEPSVVLDIGGPRFIAAIVAGIILAMGFQAVLTALSFALGLSMTPNLMKAEAKRKAEASGPDYHHDDDDDSLHLPESHTAAGVVITGSLGLWAAITTSIAIFWASFFATNLSLTASPQYGMMIGLVIWAAFLMMVTYLEWKGARSLVGGIVSIATSGLQSGVGFIQGMTHKSDAKRLEDLGSTTVNKIYRDLTHALHKEGIDKKLGKYLRNLKPESFDFDRLHDEFAGLLKEIKKTDKIEVHEDSAVKVLTDKLKQGSKYLTAENASMLTDTVKKAAQAARGADGRANQLYAVASKLAPSETKELRGKIEQFLSKTGRQELSPEELYRDIEAMIGDPAHGIETIKARFAHFDRGTLSSILSQFDIDQEKADWIMDSVGGTVSAVMEKYGVKASDLAGKASDFGNKASEAVSGAQEKVTGKMNDAKSAVMALPQKIEQKIGDYFDSLERPELNYAAIKMDIEDIMHDPMSAPHVLKERLGQMDTGSIQALLASNPWIGDDHARKVMDQIHTARESVAQNVARLHDRALAQYERTRRRAVIAAEHARETAISAAWWATASAVLSAASAIAGGYIAATVPF